MFFYCLILEQGDILNIYDNFEAIGADIATYLHRAGVRNKEKIILESKKDKLNIYHYPTGKIVMIFYVGYEDGFFVRYINLTELWELGNELSRWFRVEIME